MRMTAEDEAASIARADQGVLDARADMARLHDGGATPSPDVAAMEARYVQLAERRAAQAREAHERGERRRQERAHWRQVFGLRPLDDEEE